MVVQSEVERLLTLNGTITDIARRLHNEVCYESEHASSIQDDEARFFSPHDSLGRIWFRIYSEGELLNKHWKEVLPEKVRAGYMLASAVLTGLWMAEVISQIGNGDNSRDSPLLSNRAFRQVTEKYFEPYRDIAQTRLQSPNYTTKGTVGLLMRHFYHRLETKEEFSEGRENWGIGADLVWHRWRVLSTEA